MNTKTVPCFVADCTGKTIVVLDKNLNESRFGHPYWECWRDCPLLGKRRDSGEVGPTVVRLKTVGQLHGIVSCEAVNWKSTERK